MKWEKIYSGFTKKYAKHNDNFVFAVADRGTTSHQTTALPSKPVGRPREPKHFKLQQCHNRSSPDSTHLYVAWIIPFKQAYW